MHSLGPPTRDPPVLTPTALLQRATREAKPDYLSRAARLTLAHPRSLPLPRLCYHRDPLRAPALPLPSVAAMVHTKMTYYQIHEVDVKPDEFFVDMGVASMIRTVADDHEAGGSGNVVISCAIIRFGKIWSIRLRLGALVRFIIVKL